MKRVIVITCTSFTMVTVLGSLLSATNVTPDFSTQTILQLFLLTLLIAVFMGIAEKIEDKFETVSIWVDGLLRLAICYGVIVFGGVLFHWFPFTWMAIVYVSPILIPVFIITYLITYFTIAEYANKINEALKQREEK